ncbi:MAG: Dabb family protein [Rhodobacteraceae bacterium]|nr:Dabb family protein [Alphaproteobacteria bacterium]MBT8475060.1 Dabb family protein [Alphaproteobacteria bacterium]NNK66271.1 Dabb family protein [Paracoccaceae bacterium]
MIRHIVLVRFRVDITEDVIESIFGGLTALQTKLPGILGVTAGRSESPEQMERGYMHGFVIDFENWQALDRYARDPDHKALGAQLVDHAEGGRDGLLVFDLPVDQVG